MTYSTLLAIAGRLLRIVAPSDARRAAAARRRSRAVLA